MVGDGHIGDIAIDDITLSRGCSKAYQSLPGHPDGNPITPIGLFVKFLFPLGKI